MSKYSRKTAKPSWVARALGTFARKNHPLHSQMRSVSTYIHRPGQPVWTPRDYGRFADEGYIRNVIAHQSVNKIARGAASVKWELYATDARGGRRRVTAHPLLTLLHRPNPLQGGAEFFEALYTARLIAGNAYVLRVGPRDALPQELHLLRADRMKVIAGEGGTPHGYAYTVGERTRTYPVDRVSGQSHVLHLKMYHPLNDWYGLSPIEAAAYSIDQHNQAGAWNQALLQNGARPSGALVVKGQDGQPATLSEEQYTRIKAQMDEEYMGSANAGRPLLLEGGLEWKEMSMSPKDMDFIAMKHAAARDIALAFGVPPQLLGIPGDNTYANLAEARLALWEQTIIPMLEVVTAALNNWLVPVFGSDLELTYDLSEVSALAPRREAQWERAIRADFLSDEERRGMVEMDEV